MADERKSEVRGNMTLSEHEQKVIAIMREIKFGKIEIVIQDGIPIRVDEIRKSIKI